MAISRQDAELSKSNALPAGASTAANGTSLDVKPSGDFVAQCELEIGAPALNTTQLPDTKTVTYSVQDSANDTSFATIADAVLIQTGAGGVGAAAATKRFRLPSTVRRYVRVVATTGSATGNCSASSFTTKLLT